MSSHKIKINNKGFLVIASILMIVILIQFICEFVIYISGTKMSDDAKKTTQFKIISGSNITIFLMTSIAMFVTLYLFYKAVTLKTD
jgi:hypothetical protein